MGATTLPCQPSSSFTLSPCSEILPATLLYSVGVTWRSQACGQLFFPQMLLRGERYSRSGAKG